MGVEKIGPKAYDYQYLVTLQMLLNNWKRDELECYVENRSFEDAQILFRDENRKYKIEIQVKNRSNEISYEEFSRWIAHFANQRADRFILDEIEECDNNYLLFVTNNRCQDKVSKFITENKSGAKGGNVRLDDNEVEELKNTMLAAIGTKTDLQRKRQAYLLEYFNNSTEKIKKVIKRVGIVERNNNIEQEIGVLLKTKFHIPENECMDVLNKMMEIVRDGRNSGNDIVPQIGDVIKTKSFRRILQEDDKFFLRESISSFKNELEENNILLLTGVPVSGKTYVAKTIAQELQDAGVYVKISHTILGDTETYAFMNAPDNDCRLLILEDPFGHFNIEKKSIEIMDSVKQLIDQTVSSNRKLIITCRRDILLETSKKRLVSECVIGRNDWRDVSIMSAEEMDAFWRLCYGSEETSIETENRIIEFLKEKQGVENGFLEIGEIRHLSFEYPKIEDLQNLSVAQIIAEARISAECVYDKIGSMPEEFQELFMILGCICNTIRAVNQEDLAYIFCSDEEMKSLRLTESASVTVTIGGRQENAQENPVFPTYGRKIAMDRSVKGMIKRFCDLGYIYRDSITKEIYFQHPIYAYASRLLLKTEIEEDWETEKYIGYLHRAIGSLSKNAAICSLISLLEEFTVNELVIKCFIDASNSIFPAVRDIAVLFLDKNFDIMTEEDQKKFVTNIKNARISDKYLLWSEDECWYKQDNQYHVGWNLSLLLGKKATITEREIEDRLKNKKGFLKKEVYDILYSNMGDKLSFDFFRYALLFDEAVIRSKAMYYLVKNYPEKMAFDEKWRTRYENYNVIYDMLSGAFHNLSGLSEELIQSLSDYFGRQVKRKSVALAVEKLFDKFGDEYDSEAVDWTLLTEEGKEKLWKFWVKLYLNWLLFYPAKYMDIHEPHMAADFEKSLEYLKNQEEIIRLGIAWLHWLDEYSKFHRPSGYGMSVLRYIILGTSENPDLRKNIIAEALQESKTSIITSHIAHIVDQWSLLTKGEQADVCDFLKNVERLDKKWICAVALTRKRVPDEIKSAITKEIYNENDYRHIMELADQANILEECVCVYNGFPQPLWYNGYHHEGTPAIWNNIMLEIIKGEKESKVYYLALMELVDGLYSKSGFFSGEYDLYRKIVSTKVGRERIFNYLLCTLTKVDENKKMWDIFFEFASEEEKSKYFKILCEYIELLEEKHMGYKGLCEEFEEKNIQKYIIPQFSHDKLIIDFLRTIYRLKLEIEKGKDAQFIKIREMTEDKIDEVNRMYCEMVTEFYKMSFPKLLYTNEIVKYTMEMLNIKCEDIEQLLKEAKEDFWKRYKNTKKKYRINFEEKYEKRFAIENWNI